MSKNPNKTRRTRRPWQQYGIPENPKPATMHKPSIVATIFSFFVSAKVVEQARKNATPVNVELREQRRKFLEKYG